MADGLLIPIGAGSDQRWVAGQAISAGIASGYVTPMQSTAGRAPTVDHFRPLSRFPRLAYEWSNWVFSCYACNGEYKKDKWGDTGYVDPSAAVVAERPEQYFDYDADTGQIVPQNDLSGTARRKASDTIRDLGLNRLNVMLNRQRWTLKFRYDVLELPVSARQAFVELMTGRVPYAGTTRMVVEQLRQGGHI